MSEAEFLATLTGGSPARAVPATLLGVDMPVALIRLAKGHPEVFAMVPPGVFLALDEIRNPA